MPTPGATRRPENLRAHRNTTARSLDRRPSTTITPRTKFRPAPQLNAAPINDPLRKSVQSVSGVMRLRNRGRFPPKGWTMYAIAKINAAI